MNPPQRPTLSLHRRMLPMLTLLLSSVLVMGFCAMLLLTMTPTRQTTLEAQLTIDVSQIAPGTMLSVIPDKHVYGYYGAVFVVHRTPEQIAWLRQQPIPDAIGRFLFPQQPGLDPLTRSLDDRYFLFTSSWYYSYFFGSNRFWPLPWGDWFPHYGMDPDVIQFYDGKPTLGCIWFSWHDYLTHEELAENRYWSTIFDLAGSAVWNGGSFLLSVPRHRYDESGNLIIGPRYEDGVAYMVESWLHRVTG